MRRYTCTKRTPAALVLIIAALALTNCEVAGRSHAIVKNSLKSSAHTTKKSSTHSATSKHSSTTPAEAKQAERQRELLQLKHSIELDRSKIASLRTKETSTMQAINQYRRHSENIRRYMSLLEDEIQSLQDKADSAHTLSEVTAGDLWRLRQRYATLVQAMLKKESTRDGASATATEQASLALEADAIRRVSSQAHSTFRTLADKRDSLSDQSQKLRSRSEKRTALLNLKDNEQKELDRTIAATQKALESIRADKSQVLAHLKKNEKSAAEISRLITSMVVKEQRAPASKKTMAMKGDQAPTSKVQTSTLKAKSLPYPVASRRILHGFGMVRNNVTNTQTNNPGIDIATPQGTAVSVVAAGTVSLVHWLPGYGSVVIVDHHNGLRSVYANLSSVAVRQGQNLSAQQSVGRSGESIDGEFVHLELWIDKQRVNPITYLH